ncbi:MAG TPA: hypothetical protein VGS12_11395 [Caulobacteraceae bacterium]|nr:hypothetical protein [Caulobacteraceae bacterium]
MAPALTAAILLHLTVLALAIVFAPVGPAPLGDSVAVHLVGAAPGGAAPASPEPTQQPSPPPPSAPPPQLAIPPRPSPLAVQRPVPTPSVQPRPDRYNLNVLAAEVAMAATRSRSSAPAKSAGARSPSQSAEGEAVGASDMAGLQGLLERLWNPNCAAVSGEGLIAPVSFSVGQDGRLTGPVRASGANSNDPVVFAAVRRAIDAIHEVEPYARPYRGKNFTVIFDARKACAQ